MKIAFATVDLLKGRERLMPWRTVMEVAKYAQNIGHEVFVLTLAVASGNTEYDYDGLKIRIAPRGFETFAKYVKENKFDVLFYPTPWREGLKNLSAFSSIDCVKIAYFPGGTVHLKNIIALGKNVGWKAAMPYLADWLTPYRITMSKLKKVGFSTIVAQSPYTAETCRKAGFADVRMIVPGKDDFDSLSDSPQILDRLNITGKKYILFAGAPAPVRGASHLLKAIDKAANDDKSICSLFLMRIDVGSDFTSFEQTYTQLLHKENILISDSKLTRQELKTVVAHARAVALPFLLVPSEIPITFFEVLSVGTPVVTFENGGTTDYLADSVLTSAPGDIAGLARIILRIWHDDALCEMMRSKAVNKMKSHPSWENVAKEWLDCIKKDI